MKARFLVSWLMVAAALASAQENPPAPPPAPQEPPLTPGETRIRAERSESGEEGGVSFIFLSGDVRVRQTDFSLSAARAIVWFMKGTPRPFDEIYAEGNVVLEQKNQKLQAERLYFNFEHNRAVIIELKGKSFSPEFKQTLHLTAREARMTSHGTFEADEVSLSTCSYGVPHYHLSIASATLRGREERAPRGPLDLFPFGDWRFRAEEIYPEMVGGAPLFFVPGVIVGSWIRDFPVKDVKYGRTSRFGHTMLTDLGQKIKMRDAEGKSRTWGEVTAEADWREKRGGGWGLDLNYRWADYSGLIDTYFLHDLGRDPDVAFDAKFPPLERRERGRAHLFHRQDLEKHWRSEVEASWLSDEHLLEEFFEREFKSGKEPETAAYVRWIDGNQGAWIMSRHRINDFQTQNEYLPRLQYGIFHEPLWEPLVVSHRLDIAHLRRRFDDALHLPSERIWRTDLVTAISAPVEWIGVQAAPFIQQRLTWYDDDLSGDTEFRSLWTAGGRLATQIHGTNPDIAWDLVGLNGLRHVVDLEARYANTVDGNLDPSDLFTFDEVDTLDEFEEAAFEMHHRFQTRDDHGRPFQFLSLGASMEYYPDSARDTGAANGNTYMPPFNWMLLTPDPRTGLFERRLWSNVQWDFSFTPRKYFQIGAAGEYNPDTRHEEIREMGVSTQPFTGLTASASRTFVRGLTDAYSISGSWSVTEKWMAAATAQFDVRTDKYTSQSLLVSRDYHDFMLQAVVEHDFGRDERRFYVTFVPKFLGPRDRGIGLGRE